VSWIQGQGAGAGSAAVEPGNGGLTLVSLGIGVPVCVPGKQVFHKQHYKGRQEDIMKASLQGSDIVVIAPTGMGKSLCFQVPAVAEKHGLTLVVSPLLCKSWARQ
jgi:hypothetical protein